MFDKCNIIVNEKIAIKDSFTDRIAKKYSAILLTTQLINECFDLGINENDVIDLALIAEKEQFEERNKSKNAYEAILQYFYNHKSQFDIRDTNGNKTSVITDRVGIALYKFDGLHLKIQIQTVQKILSELGYTQIWSYKKEWKNKGYIACEQGRFDMSNQEIGRHYHFVYPNIKLEITGEK